MPSAALTHIERRLTELACPPGQLRRKIRELAEHHDDLKHDALEEGLSEAEAEARADKLLGEPMALTQCLAAALRQSSWWGRHPVIGFCLLPPLAIIPLLIFGMWAEYWLGRLYFTDDQLGSLADWDTGLKYCRLAVMCTYYAAMVVAAILFCNVARRTVAGFKWAAIACVMCALHGLFFFVALKPHNLTIGYMSQPQWLGGLPPLLVALIVWLLLRRAANRLAPIPAEVRQAPVNPAALAGIPRTRALTPTTVILVLALAAIGFLGIRAYAAYRANVSHHTRSGPKVEPVERVANLAQ